MKMTSTMLPGLLVALLLGLGAQAAPLYKWIDENGRVSYHDRPPPEDSGYRVEKKSYSRQAPGKAASAAYRRLTQQNPITVYLVPNCASCTLVTTYLSKHQLPFVEKDVNADAAAKDTLFKLSGAYVVPLVTIGDRIVKGYESQQLEAELKAVGFLPSPDEAGNEEPEQR